MTYAAPQAAGGGILKFYTDDAPGLKVLCMLSCPDDIKYMPADAHLLIPDLCHSFSWNLSSTRHGGLLLSIPTDLGQDSDLIQGKMSSFAGLQINTQWCFPQIHF